MATVNKIIERVDSLRRNVFEDEDKGRWILEVESRVCNEILKKKFELKFPEDGDRELALPDEESAIYEYYVYCMIDWHNREYSAYNNDFIMFNSLWDTLLKKYGKIITKKNKFINIVP